MTDSPETPLDRGFRRAAERHERIWLFMVFALLILLTIGSLFFVVRNYGLVVAAATPAHAQSAAPSERLPAAGTAVQTGPKAYSVHMLGHLWAWTPSPLHVPQGSAVTFYISSADVLHGFQVQGTPINVEALPGRTARVSYTFNRPGEYHIICNEYCGLEHQAMIGVIVVDPEART